MSVVKAGAWVGAAVVAATAACLPKGPPPAGRQILADRGAVLTGLVPPNGDGLLRILLLRQGATTDSADLSEVSLDQSNQPSPEVPLISGIDPSGVGCGVYGPAPCRVELTATLQVRLTAGAWTTVNTITGEIGPQSQTPPSLSSWYKTPGGRSFEPDDSYTMGTLVDGDGHTTPIALGRSSPFAGVSYRFFGEDFLYVDPQQNLIDVPPSDVPRQLATAVLQFTGSLTPDGPVLILTRLNSSAVLDAQGTETTLPFDGSRAELSGDGRWVLDTTAQSAGTFTFFDYRSGVEQTAQIDDDPINLVWRPGTSELWITASAGADECNVWVVRPDAPAVSRPGAYMESVYTNGIAPQSFTDDGAYWFFTTSFDSSTQVIQVASADDPTGPAFPLNPPSTYLSLALPLADGRMLTTAYAKDQDRSDVTAVDPRTGQTDVLARRGLLLTSGTTRLMGLFHVIEARGDLTTIDLGTGQATVLAPEFTVSAVAELQGPDPLAPGARIVYQFQARSASPYDGIWVTNSP